MVLKKGGVISRLAWSFTVRPTTLRLLCILPCMHIGSALLRFLPTIIINNRLFMAPHLIRAQSAFKDIRIHSFHHTHTHTQKHARARARTHTHITHTHHTHTHTHTHKQTHTHYKYMHYWWWIGKTTDLSQDFDRKGTPTTGPVTAIFQFKTAFV